MKTIADILYKTGLKEIIGANDKLIKSISFDSRNVSENSMFVAVKGINTDGHLHIDNAVENGAVCIVCEKFPEKLKDNATYAKVRNSSVALAEIASNFYDNPSEKIKLIGITGTNGKTTIATLLHNLFLKLGYKSGLISTVNYQINDKAYRSDYTTPDAVSLNSLLAEMVNENCEYCFMEVSSHAVIQNRIAGLNFSGGVFSNLSQDHLDYHQSFKDYLLAKKSFFDSLPENSFALTNVDDKNGWVMMQNTKAKKHSYSLHSMADFKGKIISNSSAGLGMEIMGLETWFKLVGKFNAYNILAVYSTAALLFDDHHKILTALSSLNPVEGRFQHVRSKDNINAIVDYAHTPDALENVLKTLQEISQEKESKIITVFGCGGNRDATKRPLMGAIAVKYSQKVIITTDNPRFEDPIKIIDDIISGLDNNSVKKTLTIPDRKEAIKTACSIAKDGDIVLIAGKGHEKYQEINGIKAHFDDIEVVLECLEIKCKNDIN